MKSLLFAVLVLACGSAAAHPHGIDARQHRQEARVVAGVARGELTACEALRLERRGDRIAAREARYRASAGLGPLERRDLHRRLDAHSREIAEQRHDGRRCR